MNIAMPASASHPPPASNPSVTTVQPVDRLCCEYAVSLPTPVRVQQPKTKTSEASQSLDTRAIEAAIAPHLSMLRQVAHRILRCSEQADDAVQDAIIVLWKRGERPVELRGWLVKTVIHRSLHRRRTEMRRRRWEEEASIAVDVTCPLCDPEEEFAQREFLAVAEAAMSGLAREHQIVIELRSRGLEYEEIAQRLELPIGTVRSRLNRARRALRDHLAHAAP